MTAPHRPAAARAASRTALRTHRRTRCTTCARFVYWPREDRTPPRCGSCQPKPQGRSVRPALGAEFPGRDFLTQAQRELFGRRSYLRLSREEARAVRTRALALLAEARRERDAKRSVA